MMTYTNRYSHYDLQRGYKPFFYSYGLAPGSKTPTLSPLNTGAGTEYLTYSEGGKLVTTSNYIEAALNYNHLFGKHNTVSGMLIGTAINTLNANSGSLQGSLPFRNEGV